MSVVSLANLIFPIAILHLADGNRFVGAIYKQVYLHSMLQVVIGLLVCHYLSCRPIRPRTRSVDTTVYTQSLYNLVDVMKTNNLESMPAPRFILGSGLHLDPIVVEKRAFVMHKFKIKQAEWIYQLKHHIFLRLAKWCVTANEITLLKFFEYLAESAVVCHSRSIKQVLSGHALALVLQGCNYGQVVVCFLEERIKQTLKFFRKFSTTCESKLLDILRHAFVVLEKRQVISHSTHSHITFNNFRSLIIETLRFKILFHLM